VSVQQTGVCAASCPDRSGYVQCPGYEMPGAVVLFESVDSVLRPCWHMAADFCETGINSVILAGIYEYIFQEIELVCGFLARI
jgi:hypothetical protein